MSEPIFYTEEDTIPRDVLGFNNKIILDSNFNLQNVNISSATSSGIENIIYVSKGGNDENSGSSILSPVLTIKKGLELAAIKTAPCVISVYPGKYIEDGNLAVPIGMGVVSSGGQYVTEVIASDECRSNFRNMFLVNSGSYVQGFTFRNQEIDDFEDPTGGFAIAFVPGATIFRSPYIRDCSQVSNYEAMQIAAPLDPANGNPLVGKGGGMLLADRAILNSNSIFPYMLAFGATPRSPNGMGYVAKNGAGINGISSISIFQRCAFYSLRGGQITLNNSGTQFGDISMRSKGSISVVSPNSTNVTLVKNATAAEIISSCITDGTIQNMWDDLISNGPMWGVNPPNWSAAQEVFTKRDAANLLKALAYDVEGGVQTVTKSFVLGFFGYGMSSDPTPVPSLSIRVFPDYLLDSFVHTYNFLKNALTTKLSAYSDVVTMISGLIDDVLIPTLTSPTTIDFGSLVESLGHQFNNAGAGVNKNALPLNFRRPGANRPVPFSVQQEVGGRVRWSGADEINNQYFAGGTIINGVTGKFEGRPFNSAVRQIARRLANSRGSF